MKTIVLALLLMLASCSAYAQGCGPSNPLCIVPTAPAGTNNNQAASTAYVQLGFFGTGNPWVDVKSGANGCAAAVGDGSTDDSGAIQCQINFMASTFNGGIVYAPPATYHVASTLTLKKGVMLLGAGRAATTISASTDITVIIFDSATCNQGIGFQDLFVLGRATGGETQDVVVVQTGCTAIVRDNYVWGGHHALNTAGTDGHYENTFFCGWTGDNIFSTGANWYVHDKLDACGNPSTANGFEQGTTSVTAENQIVQMDLSCGTCTNSISINDGAGTHAITKFNQIVTAKPIVITNARETVISDSELSSNITGSGITQVSNSVGLSSITVTGGTVICSANNVNISCWQTWSPSISCGTGTITTLGSVTGVFYDDGPLRHIELVIPITTNGTCASFIIATLPSTPSSANYMIPGVEAGASGKILSGRNNGGANMLIVNYDGSYPGASGASIRMNGWYRTN